MKSFIGKTLSFRPTLKESWMLFVCTIVFGSLLSTAISFIPIPPSIKSIISYISVMLPPFVYSYIKVCKKSGGWDSVVCNRPKWRIAPIIAFPLFAITLVAFLVFTDPILSLMPTPEWFEKLLEDMMGENIYVAFITTSIAAPILEEALCRGLILNGLIANGKTPLSAIVWSSLIFGLLHLNPWQAIPAFLMGMLFGWLYYKTKSLWVPIWLHFVNNTLALVMFKIYPSPEYPDTFRELINNDQIFFAIYAIAIGVLALSFFLITKYFGKNDDYTEKTTIPT